MMIGFLSVSYVGCNARMRENGKRRQAFLMTVLRLSSFIERRQIHQRKGWRRG
jgi:hypothetical protein